MRHDVSNINTALIQSNREKVISLSELSGVNLASSIRKRRFPRELPVAKPWCFRELAGRLAELSAVDGAVSALLTTSLGLVADAQREGEPVCWIMTSPDTFFPPDAADTGVNLTMLPVIRIMGQELSPKRAVSKALRAAEILARSGAFGLVVVDLGALKYVPVHALSRLKGQAQKHDTTILFLTQKSSGESSLGSLISLRGEAHRVRMKSSNTPDPHIFNCGVKVLKDKRRGPGRCHIEKCYPPPGLCSTPPGLCSTPSGLCSTHPGLCSTPSGF